MRKPIWFPTAPSKLYNIREPTYYAPDEFEQLEVLERKYRDGVRSLQKYLEKEVYLASMASGGYSPEQVKAEEDEQARLLEENNKENERIRLIREEMTIKFQQEIEEQAFEKEFNRLKEEMYAKELAKIDIENEIERSKTYITRDRFEEAIEYALSNPVSYEFAIDLNGKIIGASHPSATTPMAIPDSSGLPLRETGG